MAPPAIPPAPAALTPSPAVPADPIAVPDAPAVSSAPGPPLSVELPQAIDSVQRAIPHVNGPIELMTSW